MNALQLIGAAGIFVAGSNLCMRRSIDSGGTTKGFLMIQLLVVFLVAILLNPVRNGDFSWSLRMALFGVLGGIVLGLMMASLGKALESGPPGLTFAALNSSTVMPSLLMAVWFGSSFGYGYNLWNAVGSLLVVMGLFWAGRQVATSEKKRGWSLFTAGAFLLHILFLIFLSGRALMLKFPTIAAKIFYLTPDDLSTQWFMPMVFLVAWIFQIITFLTSEKRKPKREEVFYGLFGGISNGVGTFFMILATEIATPLQQAMMYPIFSIAVIVLCNSWGRLIYKEKIHWRANAICILGILIGSK